jgi:hypothetical protein
MAADDDTRSDAGESVAHDVVRCELRDRLLVAPRRRVAEERLTDTFDVERDREWKRAQERAIGLVELRCRPLGQSARCVFEELAIGVAADRHAPLTQLAHARQRLPRKRARRDIAAEDDQVDVQVRDLGNNNLLAQNITLVRDVRR